MKKITFIIFLIYFAIQYITLSHYGINWDEERRDYRSQAYLHYFLTGKKNYSDLKEARKSFYQSSPNGLTFDYFTTQNIIGHPPIADIMEAFSNYIFYQKLGILSDTDSYHVFIIFTSSLLVAFTFLFVASEYTIFAGLVAAISLGLYPLFFGESHFNFKDPVETSLYALTTFAFLKGITKKSKSWILSSAVIGGFALGTKYNIFFAGVNVFLWICVLFWGRLKKMKWPFDREITMSFLVYPFISFGILYAFWPFLWQHPVKNLIQTFQYYAFWGYGEQFQPQNYYIGGFNTYPGQWIFFTTPILVLILTFLGIIYTVKFGLKEKNKTSILIIIWFLATVGRVTLPKVGITNGVREIMEYIPAMAILAGIGGYYLIALVPSFKSIPSRLIFKLFIIALFLPLIGKLVSIHPNENVYFNPLIGGLSGAREKGIYFWGNSFGNTYRQAANWLNQNAEKNAKVDLALSYEGNMPRMWLRNDIQYSNKFRSDISKKGEYIVEMSNDWPVWPRYCYWVHAKTLLKPVYEVKVDGVPILTIWKNDKNHQKGTISEINALKGCVKRDPADSAN